MVDVESPVPMHEQISTILKNEILKRRYGERGSIGTHSELAERFGVSLITIRRAIKTLEDENIVVVRQGKGTFVKSTVLQDELTTLTGVSNILSRANLKADVKVRDMRLIKTPGHFSPRVRRAMGGECLYIERTHSIDDVAIGFARLYLPYQYGRQLTREDVEASTIYQLYERKLNVPLGRGVQYISAGKASTELADILKVEVSSPVLKIERESYSAQGEIIEIMELFYEYTQYAFKVELDLRS